jgi:hypothetical protein
VCSFLIQLDAHRSTVVGLASQTRWSRVFVGKRWIQPSQCDHEHVHHEHAQQYFSLSTGNEQ